MYVFRLSGFKMFIHLEVLGFRVGSSSRMSRDGVLLVSRGWMDVSVFYRMSVMVCL